MGLATRLGGAGRSWSSTKSSQACLRSHRGQCLRRVPAVLRPQRTQIRESVNSGVLLIPPKRRGFLGTDRFSSACFLGRFGVIEGMERRNFLKALGAIAAGFALDQATGLVVPHKRIWQVGANLNRGFPEGQVWAVSGKAEPTIQLPATPAHGQITLIDRDGKEFRFEAAEYQNSETNEKSDGVLAKGDAVLVTKHFTLKFDNLVWAASSEIISNG